MIVRLFFVGSFAVLGACASAPLTEVAPAHAAVERTLLINGTPLQIRINEPEINKQVLDDLVRAISVQATTVDNTFFATGSLELINDQLKSGRGPIKLSEATGRMIADALRGYQLTDGIFDPTVGPLVRAWVAAKGGQPSARLIGERFKLVGADKLRLSSNGRELRATVVGMRLEPGGLRDGWVVAKVIELMRSRRLVNYYINFRGALYYGSGVGPGGEPWRVTVRDQNSRPVGQVELDAQSLSISYSLVPRPDGRPGRKGHIIDPRNGLLVSEQRSVVALANSPLDAEILSTALVVLGKRGRAAVGRFEGAGVLLFQGPKGAPVQLGKTVTYGPLPARVGDDYFND
jgi:thiamine biosynthesis lipoprotein